MTDVTDYYTRETLERDLSDQHLLLFVDFFQERLRGDYAPTTIQSELSYVKSWMMACQTRGVDAREATDTDIKQYLRRRQGEVSDSALNSTAVAIRKLYGWLAEGRRADNPAAGIDLDEMFSSYSPGVSERETALKDKRAPDDLHTITPADVDTMAEHCGAPRTRNELLIRLGFQTAMRPRELADAKVDDVYWEQRQIRIKTAKADADHPYYRRYVFWQPSLDSLMWRWLGPPDSDSDGERGAYAVHEDSPYIFLTRKSPQMRSEHVSRIVREAAMRAGIQEQLGETARSVPQSPDTTTPQYAISGHELRRASITHMVNKVDSLDLHEVQAIAGHKRISQTREYVADDWGQIQRKMQHVSF